MDRGSITAIVGEMAITGGSPEKSTTFPMVATRPKPMELRDSEYLLECSFKI